MLLGEKKGVRLEYQQLGGFAKSCLDKPVCDLEKNSGRGGVSRFRNEKRAWAHTMYMNLPFLGKENRIQVGSSCLYHLPPCES